MAAPSVFLRAGRLAALPLGRLSERLGNRFYIGLAVVLALVAVYALVTGMNFAMKRQAYDLIIKSRFNTPAPDPDIVLIDIDEASLEAMAPQYGRWPWPRAVMAELVEGLARQQPRAIVFDIAFSDADVYQAQADQYFREVIAATPNTYFPMIRLNPDNDTLSELRLSQLAGVQHLEADAAAPSATVAMIVPYFYEALEGRRLGTINLYADEDGITRRYHVYRDVAGYRIYSLAANVAAALGAKLPEQSDILLNWRGRPLVYQTLSFHTVYDALAKTGGESAAEFKDKVVVIGSTAPSLFDIKPTPLAKLHPSVEILTTALDNLRRGDYLTELPPWIYLIITVCGIAALAAAFVYNVDDRWVNVLFTLTQTAFLAVSYLFLNYSTWFVDLTAPFTAGIAYFTIARFYSLLITMRRNGHPLFSAALDTGRPCQVLYLSCRIPASDKATRRRVSGELLRRAGLTRYGVAAARIFKPAPLLYDAYRDTLLFYWLVAPEQTCAALQDQLGMMEQVLARLERHGADVPLRLGLHSVSFTVDAAGAWRDSARAALIEALVLPEHATRTLHTTRAFDQTAAGCPAFAPSERLRRAGFQPQTSAV